LFGSVALTETCTVVPAAVEGGGADDEPSDEFPALHPVNIAVATSPKIGPVMKLIRFWCNISALLYAGTTFNIVRIVRVTIGFLISLEEITQITHVWI
jgi:hypothetical protein